MIGRTIAIGDIHGCSIALRNLIDDIEPQPEDTIITLGDHIDRGPDTRGVIDQLLLLSANCQLIHLRGNHECMYLEATKNPVKRDSWLRAGGLKMLESYGWTGPTVDDSSLAYISDPHHQFLQESTLFHETAEHLFMHAGYIPELPMPDQPEIALCWKVTIPEVAEPHFSGKRVFVGHTPQRSGNVLDLGFLVCIDTNAARGGWLTAIDVHTGQKWQTNEAGDRRRKR